MNRVSHALALATLMVVPAAALPANPGTNFELARRPPLSNPRGRYPGAGARVPGKFKRRARASR